MFQTISPKGYSDDFGLFWPIATALIILEYKNLTPGVLEHFQLSHLNSRARHVAAMISDSTGLRDQ